MAFDRSLTGLTSEMSVALSFVLIFSLC